jgi:3'-phosphoadenosine 5'-phosphosulfate sulfotransferase
MYMTVEGNGGWNRIVNPTGGKRQASYRREEVAVCRCRQPYTQALPMGNRDVGRHNMDAPRVLIFGVMSLAGST